MKVVKFIMENGMEFLQNAESVILVKHPKHKHKFTEMEIDDKFMAHTAYGEVEISVNGYESIFNLMTSGETYTLVPEQKTPDYVFKGYASADDMDNAIKKMEEEKKAALLERDQILNGSKKNKKGIKSKKK
jgi:hypothetical protein